MSLMPEKSPSPQFRQLDLQPEENAHMSHGTAKSVTCLSQHWTDDGEVARDDEKEKSFVKVTEALSTVAFSKHTLDTIQNSKAG